LSVKSRKEDEDLTAYMYISKKKVVGLLMVKRMQQSYAFLLNKEDGDGANSSKHNDSPTSISQFTKAL